MRGVALGGGRRALMLRRSRGYVPASIGLPVAAPRPLLACGGQLKATFCLARGRRAWVSHHIGDLEHYPALLAYRQGIEHFERLFALRPELVAYDLHPDYASTAFALELDGVELTGVQHHHAHLAACLAEHGLEGPAVGAIYDGSGYGTDGTIWGGEILVGDLVAFERAVSLRPVRMPGGARAVHEPWRMACAWLASALGGRPPRPRRSRVTIDPGRWRRSRASPRARRSRPRRRAWDGSSTPSRRSAACVRRSPTRVKLQLSLRLRAGDDDGHVYSLPLADEHGRRVLDPRGGDHVHRG